MTKTHPRGDGWGEEGGVKTPQEIFFFFFFVRQKDFSLNGPVCGKTKGPLSSVFFLFPCRVL